ncbi:MAG: hypothetical protein R6W67_02945 [Bacteroidales bacterium]
MKKAVFLLLIMLPAAISCNRESDDFLWEYTGGNGGAHYLALTPDSGYISAGAVDGKPYLMKSDRAGNKIFSFSSEMQGSFRSVWYDTAFYMVAGGSEGDLLLTMLDPDGDLLWEKKVEAGISVSEVFLFPGEFDGEIIAICGTGPDEPAEALSGIMKVICDTAGNIGSTITRDEPFFFRLSGAVALSDGGYMLATTESAGTAKPVAAMRRITSTLSNAGSRTELSNNPSYSAASLDICSTVPGEYLVSGRTELSSGETIFMNSFLSMVRSTGSWKKYPENSNEGVALFYDGHGLVYMLNRNCFIVTVLSIDDGSEYRRLRIYNACDSYDTDALAETFVMTHDGNLLLAGIKGGRYYLTLKPVSDE